MIAVLGGVGAALCWAMATLCSARSSRLIGVGSTLAWVMGIGFVVVVPPMLIAASAADLSGSSVTLLTVSGLGNLGGLGFEYAAVRRGKIGVVAPIASTEGAIAAVLATIAGEPLGTATALLLVVIAVGVALGGMHRDDDSGPSPGLAVALACGAAACFGLSLYSVGKVSSDVSLVWTLVPPRLLGVALIAAPLAARAELRITRQAAPLVTAAGIAEVVGILSFAVGARHQIAIAAVLASQFAALASAGAYAFLGERLGRAQLTGLATVAIGVAALSAQQAR